MFTFVVCVVLSAFASTLGEEYYPEYLYHPYEEEYAPEYNNYEPKDYHFSYEVSDPHTGDHKSQWEIKQKGVVRGMYSLLEPDGTTRIVEYIADDHGFRATVKKIGLHYETETHHGGGVGTSLPEAFNSGYHGAYSGELQNYGIGSYTAPIGEQDHIQSYGLEDQLYLAPIIASDEGIETAQIHSAPIITSNVGIETSEIHSAPIITSDVGIETSHIHSSPIISEHPHETVEIHGFTGNPDDDSSYTNYDHEEGAGINSIGAISSQNGYINNIKHVAQPEIIPVAYKLPDQYYQPWIYSGQSYNGY